ncbi:MAG: type II secretion system protein [Planctomycetaceae bacterium]|nr:type II secretion system protein [Planctomycetaceae bacterium]
MVRVSQKRRQSLTGPPRRAIRSAFTLVELTVVISIISLIVSLLSVVMVRMMNVELKTRSQVSDLLSMCQLSDQFRQDIHQANGMMIESIDGEDRLTVDLDDDLEAVYTAELGAVTRTLQRDKKSLRRAKYRLPTKTVVKWSRADAQGQLFVTMQIVSAADQNIFVISQLGRHFQQLIEQTKVVEGAN